MVAAFLAQMIVASQFYIYGRKHFTANGWRHAYLQYPQPDLLDTVNLGDKNFLVTGATSGIGREVATRLTERGATVYIVCRGSTDRARRVAEEIAETAAAASAASTWGVGSAGAVVPLVGDVSLAADVRRVAREVDSALEAERLRRGSSGSSSGWGLDGVVCNAGALLHERTLTSEGVETTLAAHLAHGTYLLTNELRPSLQRALDPRVIMVSSGGMLTSKWPGMPTAASTLRPDEYDGQLAYAYAKRGQVLLAQEWAKREEAANNAETRQQQQQQQQPEHSRIKYVSCHPGWVATPGVDSAYGKIGSWLLAPLRSCREGGEGVAWLAAVQGNELESGGFYLDRAPQPLHLPGGWIFNRGGKATHNTADEVGELMSALEALAGSGDGTAAVCDGGGALSSASSTPPLSK
mmetsp:Transcript_69867/g.140634  ORF Transcript_69867/g.140634 Transcript_69867/m.140634 type:complete len:409 (+) Transcript_69867:44-1270(+)